MTLVIRVRLDLIRVMQAAYRQKLSQFICEMPAGTEHNYAAAPSRYWEQQTLNVGPQCRTPRTEIFGRSVSSPTTPQTFQFHRTDSSSPAECPVLAQISDESFVIPTSPTTSSPCCYSSAQSHLFRLPPASPHSPLGRHP